MLKMPLVDLLFQFFVKKRIAIVLLAVFAAILIPVMVINARQPAISFTNIEKFRGELSSNAPVVIAFNQLVDRKSAQDSFQISPQITGRFKWSLNKMTFAPDERFIVGQTYTVTLNGSLKNLFGKTLGQDKVFTFLVVDAPKVSLAVPNGDTSEDSKITVMFDRPMVALSTYDVYEAGGFPLEITPVVSGRFKWIGSSAFQFIPENRFSRSTVYTAKIPAGFRSLDSGRLEETFTFTFSTPRIRLMSDSPLVSEISGRDPFILRFNQDVNLESVLKHTRVFQKPGGEIELRAQYEKRKEVEYQDGGQVEKEIEDKKIVHLFPKRNDWGYDNIFQINVEKGIFGLEGNEFSQETISDFIFTTKTFLAGKTPNNGDKEADPFLKVDLDFDQEVGLQETLRNFSVEPAAEFTAAYDKKCDPKWEPKESPDEECAKIDDLTSVVLTAKSKLPNLTRYRAKLAKTMRARNGIAYFKEDEIWTFETADSFKVLRTNPVEGGSGSYKTICLFTTTLPDTKDIEKLVEFRSANKGKAYFSAYSLRDAQYNHEYSGIPSDYVRCEKRNENENYVLRIDALLNPETAQRVTLSSVAKDIFGQSLGLDFVLNFQTEQLKNADMSLDILQNKIYAFATLDQHAAPVFASVNLRDFDLEICRLSAEKILEVDTQWSREENKNKPYYEVGWQGFIPSNENCLQYRKNNKKLRNSFWETQYTEIDLASELNSPPAPGYYYLGASSPRMYLNENIWTYSAEQKRDIITGTRKIYTRSDQILGLTNLQVMLKQSQEQALFWATRLNDGASASGVEIKLFTEKGVVIPGSSVTDREGLARRQLNGLPFEFAIAKQGDDEVVLNRNWTEGISPWDYQLGYMRKERYAQAYIYTERPLYQPTHEVFFKGILREDNDAVLSLPVNYPSIEVQITDSRGANIYKKVLPVSTQGTFADSLKLDSQAPLGRYGVEASCLKRNEWNECVSGSFYQSFFVEKYRKPEYKLEVDFNKEAYVDKENLRALIDAEYFFGAPVAEGKVTWNLRSQNYYFDEYKEEWFSFTDHETFRKCWFGCPYEDKQIESGEGVLDNTGQFLIRHDVDLGGKDESGKLKPPDSSKIYTLEATVQDRSNQTVAGRKEAIIHRGEYYVGVKNEKYIIGAGEKMPIKVIAVDPKGSPLNGKSIEVELLKINWKYVKKKNLDGGFYWDNEMEQKSVQKHRLVTGEDGKAFYNFEVKEGGEYIVRALSTDSRRNQISSTVDFYASTQETVSWKQENNNRMELKADKASYEIGDVAKVLVKSPYTRVKALLTYERGDIFEAKIINIDSNAYVVEIPVTAQMAPNFYVSVLEVKAGNKDDPPDFKLGYANLVVDVKNKELVISIKTDKKQYAPRETVNLEITATDQTGKPVASDISVAVVDASLLALKGNPKRDLVNVFYNRRLLGILTASNLTKILERINLSDLKGSKGGGGKDADEFGKPRGEFEDTAFWRSSLATAANGKVSASFKLPDNLTTWNIEVIGATQNSLFGSQDETIITRKPVMIRPLLPRFAVFKDNLRIGAIVHNFTDRPGNFTVSITDLKNLTISGNNESRVRIAPQESAKVLFPVLVPKTSIGSLAEITMRAEGNAESDAVIQKFPIYSYSTPETVALSSFTDDISFTEKVLLPDSVDPELGEVKISTGATLATYVSDSLNYLLGFPYGCTEQIISQILPNIALKNAVSLPNLSDKIKLAPIYDENGNIISFDALVQKNLQKIYSYQRPEGGWGYFPESRESYPYVTAYTLFGLDQIKKAGYVVDQNVFSRAQNYLMSYMKNNEDLRDRFTGKLGRKTPYWAGNRAYMLFVLAEIGFGDQGLTNSLYDDRELLSNGGKAYLAMALYKLNPSAAVRKTAELVRSLENASRIEARGTYIRNDAGSSFEMMTNIKVTALALQALNRINPSHALSPKLVKWLIKARKDGRWETTQDNVAALIVLTEYLESSKETIAAYEAKVLLDGKEISKYEVNSQNFLDQHEIVRSLSEFSRGGDGTKIVFSREGSGRLYYDIALRYFLPIEEIKSRSEGFNIVRNYYKLSDEKMENPVKEAQAGETLRGRLTIIAPEDRYLVALENFLPAGFELVNFEFETSEQKLLNIQSAKSQDGYYYGSYVWTHKELRDDKLFLFAETLPKGVYEYDYYVQATGEGKFHHPPAVVSEMYFPENFGRTSGGFMEVKE